jgi:hypothetical protein
MLAPWYSLHVSARGLSTRHGFAQSFSGWQALSGAGIVCLLAAVLVCSLVLARVLQADSGLGAAGRGLARARVDGALIAAAGLVCVVALVETSVAPPTTASATVSVSLHTAVRWGVLLALALAVALTALGVQITAAAGRGLRDRRGRRWRHASQPAPGRSTDERDLYLSRRP